MVCQKDDLFEHLKLVCFPKPEATSATDGCRDAKELVTDEVSCPMAREMNRWLQGGHPERSFARLVKQKLFLWVGAQHYPKIVYLTPNENGLQNYFGVSFPRSKHFLWFLWGLNVCVVPEVVQRSVQYPTGIHRHPITGDQP